jgi:glycine/D-amino acid oxidase-like deaminating enzyme
MRSFPIEDAALAGYSKLEVTRRDMSPTPGEADIPISQKSRDQAQQPPVEQQTHVGWLDDLKGSYLNGLRTQANGAIQLANYAGANIELRQLSKVDKADVGTGEWAAEMVGQVGAMATTFALTRFGVGRLLRSAGNVSREFAGESVLKQTLISGGTGAFMNGVLNPADSITDRFKNAGVGFVTTGIMGGGSALSRTYAGRVGSMIDSPLVSQLMRNGFTNNLAAGYAGGWGGEATNALLNGQSFDISSANRSGIETAIMGMAAHGLDVSITNAPGAISALGNRWNAFTSRGATADKAFRSGAAFDDVKSPSIVHDKTDITPAWPNAEVAKIQGFQDQTSGNAPFRKAMGPLEALPSLKGNVQADVVIVGSGLIGSQQAMALAKDGLKVVVLEAKTVGSGTSQVGGAMNWFLPDPGFGPMSERLPPAELKQVVQRMLSARSSVEQLGRQYGDFQRVNSYLVGYNEGNVDVTHEAHLLSQFDPNIHLLKGRQAQAIHPLVQTAAVFPFEGNLNPAMLTSNMARSGHYQVYEQSPVTGVLHTIDGARVFTPEGSVTAKKVILATSTPMTPFEGLNDHLQPVQTFANVAKIERPSSGNFTDSPDQSQGKVPFSYWFQFNRPYFPQGTALFGSVADFPNGTKPAVQYKPQLAEMTAKIHDGAQGRDPWTALIWTVYDSDRFIPGLPVYVSDPAHPRLSGAYGGGGTGLNGGALLAQAARMDAAGKRDPFLAR